MPARLTPEAAFLKHVTLGDLASCWLSRGGGYNKPGWHHAWRVGGAKHLAHRVSFALLRGEIPVGMCVLHACDTPACCNPLHLFLGTRADNVADMWAKGRQGARRGRPGVKLGPSPFRKLTARQADQVFDLYLNGHTQRAIALRFRVTDVAVGFVLQGKTYPELNRTSEVAHLLGRGKRATRIR